MTYLISKSEVAIVIFSLMNVSSKLDEHQVDLRKKERKKGREEKKGGEKKGREEEEEEKERL